MTGTQALPFFEREDDGMSFLPAECYVAGLRASEDDAPAVRMTLPTETVDRAVLTGARLSVWLSADSGRLILDGEGVDNETLEAALDAGPMREQTLLTLINERSLRLTSLTTRQATLEDVFVHHAGHRLTDENSGAVR